MGVHPRKPIENVITPDAPLRGSFEASKSNKCVSFCPESTEGSRKLRWMESQRGGAADCHRRHAGPVKSLELYRFDRDVEAQAVRKYCRFHRLWTTDVPIEVMLMEI